MSATFPTDKDHTINELDEKYELELTDEESERLRKMTNAELLLVTELFARAARKVRDKTAEEAAYEQSMAEFAAGTR
jgi:hypothetical protein